MEQLLGRDRADEHDCGGIVELDLAPMGMEQPVQGLCRYTVDTAGVLGHAPRGAVVAKLDGARRAGEDARARSKKHRLRHNDDAEAGTEEDTQPGGGRAPTLRLAAMAVMGPEASAGARPTTSKRSVHSTPTTMKMGSSRICGSPRGGTAHPYRCLRAHGHQHVSDASKQPTVTYRNPADAPRRVRYDARAEWKRQRPERRCVGK